MALIKGLLLGMSTVVFLGPVFFTLLKNSIQKGIIYGIYTALGILVSDIAVAFICYFVAADFILQYVESPITKFLGASILFAFGAVFFFKPIKEPESDTLPVIGKSYLKSFSQGFLVNFANPTVFVIWIGFLAVGQSLYTSDTNLSIYVLGILLGIFLVDSIKAITAGFLAPSIKSSYLSLTYKIIGIIVFGFGIYLVFIGLHQLM